MSPANCTIGAEAFAHWCNTASPIAPYTLSYYEVTGLAPNTVCHHLGFSAGASVAPYSAPSIITEATVV